jgi:hypothetical protein
MATFSKPNVWPVLIILFHRFLYIKNSAQSIKDFLEKMVLQNIIIIFLANNAAHFFIWKLF